MKNFNHAKTLRTQRKNGCFLTLLIAICYLLISCLDFPDKVNLPDAPEGMGYFTLSIDGLVIERTLVPQTQQSDFKAYSLRFIPADTAINSEFTAYKTNENLGEALLFNYGNWDLVVNAYMDDADPPVLLAATGSLTNIELREDSAVTNRSIILEAIIHEGTGTFNWDITFPSGVETATMTITPIPSTAGTPETLDLLTGTGAVGGYNHTGDLELASGYYRVIISLTMMDNGIEKTAMHRDTLHVYRNMESTLTHTFTEANFFAGISDANAEVVIMGDKWLGQILTANTTGVPGSGTLHYLWYRGNTPIGTDSTYIITDADTVGSFITVEVSRVGYNGSVTSDPVTVEAQPSLTVTSTGPTKILTPISDTERTDTFAVVVSGFLSVDDADDIELDISNIPGVTGLSFSGNTTGSVTGTTPNITKTFDITVTYDGTTAFAGGTATFMITSGQPAGYGIGIDRAEIVSIRDGQGEVVARQIPVNQNNIASFNTYANTTAGLTKHYVLEGDVTLTGTNNWTAIGVIPWGFTGSFDGGNNTITGLDITSTSDYQGLFGYIGTTGLVKNVNLDNVNITVSNSGPDEPTGSGGIAGGNDGTIENCSVAGNITGYDYVGGIVGWNYDGTVIYSSVTATITGEYGVGGVVGRNQHGIVEDCNTAGDVSGQYHVGGLVGYNESILQNSYATGAVTGRENIGGIVGYKGYGTIEYCYSTGDITGEQFVGGIAGNNYTGLIEFCYSTGDVKGYESVGGIAGGNDAAIRNSYSEGAVTGIGGTKSKIGGIVGINDYNGTVEYCYALGNVIGYEDVGGIVGYNEDDYAEVKNNVALNPFVTTTAANADSLGRVVGRNDGGTLANNYAYSNMNIHYDIDGVLKNKSYPSNTTGAGTVNGAQVSRGLTGWDTLPWWTVTAGFTDPFWDGKLPPDVVIYSIGSNKAGRHDFPDTAVGYSTAPVLSVPVNNTGNQPTGILTIELSGVNADSFELSEKEFESIVGNIDSRNFTVSPKMNLAVGTYNATVTIYGFNGMNIDFDVRFTVYETQGGGNITIELWEDKGNNILIGDDPDETTISIDGSFTVTVHGFYSKVQWIAWPYLNQETPSGSHSITINGADFGKGSYELVIIVYDENVPYSTTIIFNVE